MPMYCLKCDTEGCGLAFETHAPMSKESFECPVCKGQCHKVPSTFATERLFSAREGTSFRYRFIPSEVKQKRKWMGDIGNCIKDNGQVVFSGRKEEQAFVKSFAKNVDVRPKAEMLAQRHRN